jgi:organic hydroperoxide reductase OsmC/OhrA
MGAANQGGIMHDYTTRVVWTGNLGTGTSSYKAYARTWNIAAEGKPVVECSNDPLLGGDPAKMNPEDLLISALSACHMLWYLHYAAVAGIVVLGYEDAPVARGETGAGGAGRFLSCELRPRITVAEGADLAEAEAIHHRIHEVCYIARSVNFPVSYAAEIHVTPV